MTKKVQHVFRKEPTFPQSLNEHFFFLVSVSCQVLCLILQAEYKTGHGSSPPELTEGGKVTQGL